MRAGLPGLLGGEQELAAGARLGKPQEVVCPGLGQVKPTPKAPRHREEVHAESQPDPTHFGALHAYPLGLVFFFFS